MRVGVTSKLFMDDAASPPFESSPTFVDATRKVLVVDDDAQLLSQARAALERAGFVVDTCDDLRSLPRYVRDLAPQLIVLDELVPPWSGREALRVLGPHALKGAVVVALVEDDSAANELNWLRSGAWDVIKKPIVEDLGERVEAVLDQPVKSMREALLACARRDRRTATLVVHPDTPFEGRATFKDGQLTSVSLGPLLGLPALDELLGFENARYRWDDDTGPKTLPGRQSPSSYKPRVLVVEDEDALRTLTRKQLAIAGYAVESAQNGREGLQRALAATWDVIVADLSMPVLDGWGMLRRLQEDVVARETAVLVLSAHDEFREALKAARAGARSYLKKTGRSKFLLDALQLLAAPRQQAWENLRTMTPFSFDTRVLGPVWLLSAIAENDASGRLELTDPLGKYVLVAAEGALVEALVVRGAQVAEGQLAVNAIIAARAEGRWIPRRDAPAVRDGAPWLYDAVDQAKATLAEATRRQIDELVARPDRLQVQEELASLYARIATARDLEVLKALRDAPPGLEGLASRLGLAVDDVREAIAELFRRGVVELSEPVDIR